MTKAKAPQSFLGLATENELRLVQAQQETILQQLAQLTALVEALQAWESTQQATFKTNNLVARVENLEAVVGTSVPAPTPAAKK